MERVYADTFAMHAPFTVGVLVKGDIEVPPGPASIGAAIDTPVDRLATTGAYLWRLIPHINGEWVSRVDSDAFDSGVVVGVAVRHKLLWEGLRSHHLHPFPGVGIPTPCPSDIRACIADIRVEGMNDYSGNPATAPDGNWAEDVLIPDVCVGLCGALA